MLHGSYQEDGEVMWSPLPPLQICVCLCVYVCVLEGGRKLQQFLVWLLQFDALHITGVYLPALNLSLPPPPPPSALTEKRENKRNSPPLIDLTQTVN